MRSCLTKALLTGMTVLATSLSGGEFDDAIRAFERSSYYVEPIATLLGSATNSSWFHTSSLQKGFRFYIGLPISLTYIGTKDRETDVEFVDSGCVVCHEYGGRDSGCVERQGLTVPTVFGRDPAPTATLSFVDINANVVFQENVLYSDGIEFLADMPLIPFAGIHLAASYLHTEVAVRYIGLPTPIFSVHLPGFGLQHDLGAWLLPDKLPLGLSAAYHMTFYSVKWTPGEDIEGTLELGGMSIFAGLVAGYRFGPLEVFLEGGWDYSRLSTGGELTITTGGTNEQISPSLELTGRNAFRAGLNVTLDVGYNPVIGQNVGANHNTNIGIIGFHLGKKDKD